MLKKVISVALAAALCVSAGVAGTLAYLTDRDSKANVFTVGDVSIDLNEDFGPKPLVPGVDIEKEATITNTGKNDAYVWMTIAVPSALDTVGAAYNNVIHWNVPGAFWEGYNKNQNYIDSAIEEEYLPAGSTGVADDKTWNVDDAVKVAKASINNVDYNVYTLLYNSALKPGETTNIGLCKVYMDANIDITPEGDWYHVENGVATKIENWNNASGNPVIYVSAYGIQAEGFENVVKAHEAYQAQWGTDDAGKEWAPVINAKPESGETRPAGYNPVVAGTNNVANITVVDNSDEKTNLRALYTGDGKKVNGTLTVTNCYLDGTYAMNVIGDDTGVLTVSDTDLRGWVSYDGFTSATFTDCTFAQNSNPEYYNNIRPYSAVTFTNCEFDGTTFWLDMLPEDAKVTFVNCTMNDTEITAADQITVVEGSASSVVIG